MIQKLRVGILILALVAAVIPASADTGVTLEVREEGGQRTFLLGNGRLSCVVSVGEDRLLSERLTLLAGSPGEAGPAPVVLETDGRFAVDLVWTGWRAPGLVNNAENPVSLTAGDFRLISHEATELPGGGRQLDLLFQLPESGLQARLSYLLSPDDFFVRRRLSLSDTDDRGHFLHQVWPLDCTVSEPAGTAVAKPGGFGQPAALTCGPGGAFFGLEYPAAENSAVQAEEGLEIRCGQRMGERIGPDAVESDWVVQALVPDPHLRIWFDRYLDSVRVAPLRPYTLYNSWYDLRSPEMVEDEANVMNAANVERIMESFHEKLFRRYDVMLDAFVLDDGWDVYRSDWVLREKEFPGGLSPVAQALYRRFADLGIWFGPTGGYSHRDWRLEWMGEHGYELVGDQLCLAGEKYRQLFKERVVDLVANHGVGYFKWDGIQFACSELDHGHPTGLYSCRAVLETVADLCRAVREENREIFLNITSGTWLSPWWTRYANTIWMQGYDFGYADVPSISRRDRAITYRDCVLHDGLVKNDFWFPIANLMTHGIIKGDLQKLGGEEEPLDKFTDNALLYVARGVAMYELYVTPDLLTDGEWRAIAQSIHWAKDRFPVLDSTVMIGGDPARREPYGYAHFEGTRGILAVRNPFANNELMEVTLSPSLGLDAGARSLVLERVYPTHFIEPALFASGQTLHLDLQSYETAIYEIYPLSQAAGPLFAGVVFELVDETDAQLTVRCLDSPGVGRLLNPETVETLFFEGEEMDPAGFRLPQAGVFAPRWGGYWGRLEGGPDTWDVSAGFEEGSEFVRATVALLWEPEENAGEGIAEPVVTATVDGEQVEPEVERQAGRWSWHAVQVGPGPSVVKFHLAPGEGNGWVTGTVKQCLNIVHRPEGRDVILFLKEPVAFRPLPPRPWPAGELRQWFDYQSYLRLIPGAVPNRF